MISISAAAPPLAEIIRRTIKAEDQAISDVKRRAPALIRKAVREQFPGIAAKDAGLKPKFSTGKAVGLAFLSYGQRLQTLKMTYSGKRHKLTVPGLGKSFSGKRKAGGRLTTYGRMWKNSRSPYQVATPAHRGRVAFGRDKSGLFVMAAKSRGAETGVPLLFRRTAGGRDISPIVSIATPQAIRAERAAAKWRPRLAALVAARLAHQWQRSQK